MRIVILGLSITSSWGNGHATTYRALVRGLAARGHDVLFLERDVPWYADNRDMPQPPFCRMALYNDTPTLIRRHAADVRDADLVMVGSYVPDGIRIGTWVTRTARGIAAFYDIDTPVTLAQLARGKCEYLTPRLVPEYELYLSFTGGPTLEYIEEKYGSPMTRALYCAVDERMYYPDAQSPRWLMGYMGTYSEDRQPALNRLMLSVAPRIPRDRFIVAGPQYPADIEWPRNVERRTHLPPREHRAFYNAQHFTLNITRADMVSAGYSPSVRLFEAAACGTPIISDDWPGLDSILRPGKEILVAHSSDQVLAYLNDLPEVDRHEIGQQARSRVLAQHTATHRAEELERYVAEATLSTPLAGRSDPVERIEALS